MHKEVLLDEEDNLLVSAVNYLQSIVEDQVAILKQPIDKISIEELKSWLDKIQAYVDFEISQSEGIWVGLPVLFKGNGAFIAFDKNGSPVGVQSVCSNDQIIGIVESIIVNTVPSLVDLTNAVSNNEETPTSELSASVMVILGNAKMIIQDKSTKTIDLKHLRIAVPLVYRMAITGLDYFELE